MRSRAIVVFFVLMTMAIPADASDGNHVFLFGTIGEELVWDPNIIAFGACVGFLSPDGAPRTEVVIEGIAETGSHSDLVSHLVSSTEWNATLSVRWDALLGYEPGKSGIYAIIGAGLGVFGRWGTSTYTDGTTQSGGALAPFETIELGIGLALSPTFHVRVHVPATIFLVFPITVPLVATVAWQL